MSGISINRWYHVAATYDPDKNREASLYVDGMLERRVHLSAALTIANTVSIGVDGYGGSNMMNGTIDEVRILNRSLSAAEVLADYRRGAKALGLLDNSYINYSATNNFNEREGTIEFWVKPEWDGDDGLNHNIFEAGTANLVIRKTSANNLEIRTGGRMTFYPDADVGSTSADGYAARTVDPPNDEIFGTIVNRFIVQAVIGYPLTVYGKGGQTRGYLNIKDTLQCVYKAAETPAKSGELRIFNQIMETFSANDIASQVQRVGGSLEIDVQVDHIENPRKEMEEHYYNPAYQGLVDIGVEPHYLTDEVMIGMFKEVMKYKETIRKDVIFKGVKW